MTTLKFNFSNPLKGRALVKMLGAGNALYKHPFVDRNGSCLIEIPLNGVRNEKYNVLIDRQYDNRFFAHQQNFDVYDTPIFTAAIS